MDMTFFIPTSTSQERLTQDTIGFGNDVIFRNLIFNNQFILLINGHEDDHE